MFDSPAWPAFITAIFAATIASMLSVSPLRLQSIRIPKITRLVALGHSEAQLLAGTTAAAAGVLLLLTYLAFVKQQWIVACASVPLAVPLFSWVLGAMVRRRERLLRNQLAQVASAMGGAMKANMSPAQALARVAGDAPSPLAPLLQRVVHDYNRGAPLVAALTHAERRLKLDAFTLFTSAVTVNLKQGGRLEDALERIATSISEQQRLEDKLAAATSSSRNALAVMAVFPLAFSWFFYQLDPTGYDMFLETRSGQIGIAAAVFVTYVAMRWGKAILDNVERC